MMGLTLSSEHEQTLSEPTVYQWNIPLLFLPQPPPLSLLAYHGRPIRRSFNFSFQLQFFLMSSQLSSDNISPSVSVSPLPACQSVVPFLPPHPPLPSREINMPRHVVSTRRSSYGPYQRASV